MSLSDAALFATADYVSKENGRIRVEENSRINLEKLLRLQLIIVWCALSSDDVIVAQKRHRKITKKSWQIVKLSCRRSLTS